VLFVLLLLLSDLRLERGSGAVQQCERGRHDRCGANARHGAGGYGVRSARLPLP